MSMKYILKLGAFLILFVTVTHSKAFIKEDMYKIQSPDGKIEITFKEKQGLLFYTIKKNHHFIINESRLGLVLDDQWSMDKDFKIQSIQNSTFDEEWEQPWGEVKRIRNNYNRLRITLQQSLSKQRKMIVEFRVYNDGVGFRYEIPEQETLSKYQIKDELTEYNINGDYTAWWIPAFGDKQDSEYLYQKNKISELRESVHTPLTMELGNKLFISIHEAGLINYAAETLQPIGGTSLKANLVPWSDGIKVKVSGHLVTPWRSLQIAERPGDLITSYLILNLNEPNQLKDISYVKPGKYVGIWWGMHLHTMTWHSGLKHGATTQNVKQLIDFAKKHHIQGVLVEGWNEGWDGDWVKDGAFSFTKPYPDYDIQEISEYATKNGITLIGHHETGGNVANYDRQLDSAFFFLEKHKIHAVKTGYVNLRINGKEYHQGQFMVNHHQRVSEIAAKHKVMLDIHEPIKDTGLRRTFPNIMTREGVRGTEYEAWSEGNPPSHTALLPFTRGLAGPIDYTPGIFDILFKNDSSFRVHTTLAKQLALYVVMYSPLQMAADLPENYAGNTAFKFIEGVPTDWEYTKVPNGKIGEYITVVRKDRNSEDWYMGSITNESGRSISLRLDFLDPTKKYLAEIYADGVGADVVTNPLRIKITEQRVGVNDIVTIKLAPGGGQAIRFKAI